MRLNLELPIVRDCAATQCAYNSEQACHARAITVGDGAHPACDTFLPSGQHTQDTSHTGAVGACKVAACRHNQDLECTADSIHVGNHDGHADCMTFAQR
jgi:hypothetical protein